jgi:hypothetical protein
MWRSTSKFFVGMFATAMLTNAAAVYLLHDVDADRIGRWSLAYWELTLEFLIFSLVVAGAFLLLLWIGTAVFNLRDVTVNSRLSFFLGIAVMLIQYPAEFTVRKLTTGNSVDGFLLGYILLSPVCCAAIVLLDNHKRRAGRHAADTRNPS